uniref:Uncharacterized protein n=1 Tax=Anguilla anguilla TaxID=7936 RepID=A0A0E9TKG3_ANGAN
MRSQMSGAVTAAKRGGWSKSILMPMVLEGDVHEADMGVMLRCPHTFGSVV